MILFMKKILAIDLNLPTPPALDDFLQGSRRESKLNPTSPVLFTPGSQSVLPPLRTTYFPSDVGFLFFPSGTLFAFLFTDIPPRPFPPFICPCTGLRGDPAPI